MLVEDIVITAIPVIVFGFIGLWFLLDIRGSQRNVMKYQIELAELIKIKNYVTRPAEPEPKPEVKPEPEIKPEPKPTKEDIDRANIKRAILKLVDKL